MSSVLFILFVIFSFCFSLLPIKFFIKFHFHTFVLCLSFLFVIFFLGSFSISCGQALEEEIMNHSKDLLQVVSVGQMLKTLSTVDNKDFVQSKLDTTQASYIELQERCRRKAEMLQQALVNAQLFGEDEVALMNWLNEAHTRLNEVSVEDYKIDVLENQLAEQRVHTPPEAHHYVVLPFKCINHISAGFSDLLYVPCFVYNGKLLFMTF